MGFAVPTSVGLLQQIAARPAYTQKAKAAIVTVAAGLASSTAYAAGAYLHHLIYSFSDHLVYINAGAAGTVVDTTDIDLQPGQYLWIDFDTAAWTVFDPGAGGATIKIFSYS